MRELSFTKDALTQYKDWQKVSPQITNRIKKLIQEILLNPFEGIGKPEPLKHELSGCWSRRIDREHRRVYIVKSADIQIISCKYHY